VFTPDDFRSLVLCILLYLFEPVYIDWFRVATKRERSGYVLFLPVQYISAALGAVALYLYWHYVVDATQSEFQVVVWLMIASVLLNKLWTVMYFREYTRLASVVITLTSFGLSLGAIIVMANSRANGGPLWYIPFALYIAHTALYTVMGTINIWSLVGAIGAVIASVLTSMRGRFHKATQHHHHHHHVYARSRGV